MFILEKEMDPTILLLLNVVLIVSMHTSSEQGMAKIQIPCPAKCKCYPKRHSAVCSAHGDLLKDIPEMPSYVRKVGLDSDYFPFLSRHLLRILIPNNITYLSFKSSRVQQMGQDVFSDMHQLESIELSSNDKMNTTSLKLALSSLQRQELRLLAFDMMSWNSTDMSKTIFKHLNGRHVGRLTLTRNGIEHFSNGSLIGLEGLKKLDLSHNNLKACDASLRQLKSLKEIVLSDNPINKCDFINIPCTVEALWLRKAHLLQITSFCSANGTILFPNLTVLRLDNNKISRISKNSFNCLSSLQVLGLGRNDIRIIPSGVFSDILRLQSLDLSGMKNGINKIENNAFDIPSLVKLYFHDNGFRFLNPTFAKRASLGNCPRLEILDLSNNYLPKWPEDAKSLFEGLTKLKYLYLQNVRWNLVPDKLFVLMPKVSKVVLSNNGITSLNISLFSNESVISAMALDGNRIANVGQNTFTVAFWKSIKEIDLSGNPFACNYDLVWFMDKIRHSNVTFKQYPRLYKCLSPPNRKGLKLKDFKLTARECEEKSDLVIILSACGSFCLLTLISIIAVYKGRWHIRYWVYLLRYKRSASDYTRLRDKDFTYDAFVIYCDEDSDFVHDTLVQKLENDNKYHLCIHVRDFDVGRFIVDNIVEHMKDSRHAIVVVSRAFCQSKWCKFELIIAHDRLLSNEFASLLVVMLEELDCKHMSKDLRTLIQSTTYSVWTEDKLGQQLFWNQLFASLRRD